MPENSGLGEQALNKVAVSSYQFFKPLTFNL